MANSKVFLLDDEDFAIEGEGPYFVLTTALSDHKLAYRMNTALGINLHRTQEDHPIVKKGNTFLHSTFQWFDKRLERHWVLLSNKGLSPVDPNENSLFSDPLRSSLLPPSEKVDYILNINEYLEQEEIDDIRGLLSRVPGVIRVSEYHPATNALKEALHVEIEKPSIDEQS
ncbi:MAG: IPExxxVDY family protein [Bacteroidetes bacterium]|nr:MAG: IPExxxVDY family protein [Bacteroidota bacterium]